jgi:hypothetical protein
VSRGRRFYPHQSFSIDLESFAIIPSAELTGLNRRLVVPCATQAVFLPNSCQNEEAYESFQLDAAPRGWGCRGTSPSPRSNGCSRLGQSGSRLPAGPLDGRALEFGVDAI